jgi:peptidoglycan/LPS O-acetylase OafA/YrhL
MTTPVPAVAGRRVAGLDGLRGLAALYVVMDHTYLRSFPGYPAITAPWWAGWLIYGRFAVDVFMVVSGFSLAVSPARSGWRLRGGLTRFARRRAWRILPAYWAALTFSLLVAWLVRPQPGGGVPDGRSVVVYGLLVQDMFDASSPNRAFWTIAIEAQLYVGFPLLLLLSRRFGPAAMVAAVVGVIVGVGVVAPHAPVMEPLMRRFTPEFAVLFATGVLVARVASAGERVRALPWHLWGLAAAVPVLAIIAWKGSVWTIGGHLFWVELALAPALGCLLAGLATGRPAGLVRVLDSRALRRLGSFSYSLYLTHAPIVVVVYFGLVPGLIRPGIPAFLLSLAIGVPVAIGFAWLFAMLFDIPFQRHRGRRELQAAVSERLRTSRGGRGHREYHAASPRTERPACHDNLAT